jgi:hypothetical protein
VGSTLRHVLAVRSMPVLAILLNAGCGSGSQPTAPATPVPPTPTALPGTFSSTGPESVAVGELYTSNWRSNDFRGTALRSWTATGDSFFFRWSTTAGDQIGRIGRTWTSPGFGVRVDDVRKPCVMSTNAEARDVTSGGFLIWSIYGWTHSENAGWPSPHGWNNEFYVTFRSWNGSYNGPNTHGGGYVPIGSVTIDGVDFDGYVNDMPWGTPNQTQWVIEARNATWPGSVDLSKAFAFWRSKGLPNEYVVDLTWALEAGAGAGGSSGEIQLTNIVVPTLAR